MHDIPELKQRYSFTGSLRLSLQQGDTLLLETRELFRSAQQTYWLGEIDPIPIQHRRIAVGWAVGTVVMAAVLVSGIFGSVAEGSLLSADPGAIAFLLFMMLITLALFLNTLQLSSNTYTFRAAHSQALLFSIRRNKPSKAHVDAFIKVLRSRIESPRAPRGLSAEQLREHFTKVVDYLAENDFVSNEERTAIAARIVSKFREKRVAELVRK